MIRHALRPGRIRAIGFRKVRVISCECKLNELRVKVLRDQDVIDGLRIAIEGIGVRIELQGINQIDQIWSNQVIARKNHVDCRSRKALDRADGIDVSVAELKGIVVADRDDFFVRVARLHALDQVCQKLRLGETLRADPRTVNGIVDGEQRAEVIDNDGE